MDPPLQGRPCGTGDLPCVPHRLPSIPSLPLHLLSRRPRQPALVRPPLPYCTCAAQQLHLCPCRMNDKCVVVRQEREREMPCRYGAIVLAVEMLSVLSLIFYGIWLCGKTSNDDMKVRAAHAVIAICTHI
jgi:hypothetical protein